MMKFILVGGNIASIHSHTKIHYSFPSPENFDILENDFEDYEIIASHNSFWIVEFKGKVERYVMEDFQNILSEKIDDIAEEVISQYGDLEDIRNVIDRNVANYLMLTLDKYMWC